MGCDIKLDNIHYYEFIQYYYDLQFSHLIGIVDVDALWKDIFLGQIFRNHRSLSYCFPIAGPQCHFFDRNDRVAGSFITFPSPRTWKKKNLKI